MHGLTSASASHGGSVDKLADVTEANTRAISELKK